MKFIKREDRPTKTIINVLGIKFCKLKKFKSTEIYDKNRFYNCIIDHVFDDKVKRNIIEERFYRLVGYFPNLDTPKSFNEKQNWIKLYDRHPEISRIVNKITFKDYIREHLGEGYTPKILAIYDKASEIDFEKLPNQFVLKSNCGWGGEQVLVVKDKSKADFDKIREAVNSWLVPWNNYFYQSFEYNYKDIKPQILAEEFVGELDGDIPDYKFLCFNGEPKCLFVAVDRCTHVRFNYYDLDWNMLPFTYKYPNAKKTLEKPKNFDKMLEIARKLSKPFPFVRVDFYDLKDKPLIGELTFFTGGGLYPFNPREWDYKMGEWLKLPIEEAKDEAV